jgi:hypothetical protein
MRRIALVILAVVGLTCCISTAVAGDRGQVAIDGVPVERVSIADVRKADRNIEVSKINGSRYGDLTVSCHGEDVTCSVSSTDHPRVEVLSTSVQEGERTNTTLQIEIKIDDTKATISVMWEDCRSC